MNLFINNETREYSSELLKKVIDIGIDYKLQGAFKSKKFDDTVNTEIFDFPTEGMELNKLVSFFEESILPYCANFSSEKFMGFPDAGNSIAGITGAVFADFLQQNLINSSFCSPIGTFMEIAVIQWLRNVIGYEKCEVNNISDVGGIITHGGTLSNAIAMLLARENHKKNTMKTGVVNADDFKIILPKGIAHYSIKSSQMWLGCGDNIIEVETDNYRYNLDALRKALDENKGKIMAVVAYAGDSRSMTIDKLEEVARITKESDPDIWLHVDACHGFSLAFSEELRYKINAIEEFDSISTDPHKVLMLPYTLSALLIKNPQSIDFIKTTSDLIMSEQYAFGQVTPFIGSKNWMSLKLWFLMKNLGIKEIGKCVEKRYYLAQYLKEKIDESDSFVVLNDVDYNSVMFIYVGDGTYDVEKINSISKKMKERIDSDGIYYLHQFSIADDTGAIDKGKTVYPIRYMSGNANLRKEDIDAMFEYLQKLSKEIDC